MKSKKETGQAPEPESPPTEEPAFLEQYRACYPHAEKFHVTGDNLVFPDNKEAAEAHQRCIGRGKLRTY